VSEIRVGTCGFCTRQRDYYHTFPVIELQQTFYQPPQLKTVQRWRQEAPPGFEFTLKAFQAITHPGGCPTYRRCKLTAAQRAGCGFFRGTPVVWAAWETTRALAQELHAALVVFQCPAAFRPRPDNLANLRRFFSRAERDGLRFGWEPRGPAWTAELVRDLCRDLDLLHVVDPFVNRPAYGEPHYFRLHGVGGYEYRYGDAELRQVLASCTAPLTYCMFNNTAMCEDAVRFQRLASVPAAGGVP
jgi:uncharacterized protein YecE (DUF72 family)